MCAYVIEGLNYLHRSLNRILAQVLFQIRERSNKHLFYLK